MLDLNGLIETIGKVVGILGGMVGIIGGVYGIRSGNKARIISEKALRISEKSLMNSDKNLEINEKNSILGYHTFVIWNSTKIPRLTIDVKEGEGDLKETTPVGYRCLITINPFIATGTVKGIFISSEGIGEERTITNNVYNQVWIDINKDKLYESLFVIYIEPNNLIAIDTFILQMTIDTTEPLGSKIKLKKNEPIDSIIFKPVRVNILKFTEAEIVAGSTFKDKLLKFSSKNGCEEILSQIDKDELLEKGWNYAQNIKSKYLTFEN